MTEYASRAGRLALENAGITADELDLILCATIRGDYITPSLACMIQKELGASCPAFDVNAACTGFLYALDIALGYFARKKAKKILVVAAECMSKLVDWKDRSTCVLFGDGAGAAVLAEGDGLLSIKLSASGSRDFLKIDTTAGNSPFWEKTEFNPYLEMNGKEVYKFAVAAMCGDLEEVIREAGLTVQDIDFVLPHQANMRIIETAKGKLGIPHERYRVNIERFGNTSSASIPILLDELNRAGEFQNGSLLAMSAFGGGLTTGACFIRWNKAD
jgi:3-oxoacyl-[acyl-carrier-protein] synthase-3